MTKKIARNLVDYEAGRTIPMITTIRIYFFFLLCGVKAVITTIFIKLAK